MSEGQKNLPAVSQIRSTEVTVLNPNELAESFCSLIEKNVTLETSHVVRVLMQELLSPELAAVMHVSIEQLVTRIHENAKASEQRSAVLAQALHEDSRQQVISFLEQHGQRIQEIMQLSAQIIPKLDLTTKILSAKDLTNLSADELSVGLLSIDELKNSVNDRIVCEIATRLGVHLSEMGIAPRKVNKGYMRDEHCVGNIAVEESQYEEAMKLSKEFLELQFPLLDFWVQSSGLAFREFRISFREKRE